MIFHGLHFNQQSTPGCHDSDILQIKMMLEIGEVQEEDFGRYKCIAKNPRGQTDGEITLTGNFYFC